MHVLVFSDFHLSDAHAVQAAGAARAARRARADDVWMRFRSPRFFVDGEFAALVARLMEELGDAPFEVVFNGDMFELDGTLAWGRRAGQALPMLGDEAAEVAALDRILTDHAELVEAIGRLLARASRVVFLSGNHDLGLYWPGAQRLLRRRLAAAARRAGAATSASVLRERVVFRPWFHRTAGVYIEHAMQYDPTAALPDPLLPTRADGGLWLSHGSLFFRHLMGHIGTMNPHNHESYLLGWPGYFRHWLRYYWRKGRALFLPLFPGWARLVGHAWRQRNARAAPALPEREQALLDQLEATGCSPATILRLRALQASPTVTREYSLYRFLRTLGLDRLVVGGALAAVALLAVLALPSPHEIYAAAGVALAFWLYGRLAPKGLQFTYEDELPDVAEEIAALTGDRVVLFGHTHHAGEQVLADGVRLLNSGTWANGFADPECRVRVNAARTFVWVRPGEGSADPDAALLMWHRGAIVPFDPAFQTAPVLDEPWEDDAVPAA